MRNIFKSICFFSILILSSNSLKSQQNRFLQIDLNSGLSVPVGTFGTEHMFADKGMNYSGGFDYFFNKIGFGITGGYFTNKSEDLFREYIFLKYLEYPSQNNNQSWSTKYVLFGPTFKMTLGRFEFDIYAKAGVSQIYVPNLYFNKKFFNQNYEVYQFGGTSKDWQYAWTGGSRIIYRLNSIFGLQAKADYFATRYISKIDYDNNYRNASDGNRNGVIDDAEYFESQKISSSNSFELSALNINFGVIINLGKPTQNIVQMIPVLDAKLPEEIVAAPTETKEETKPDIKVEAIPIVNAHDEEEAKKAEEERKILEPVAIPETTYDAPEAAYDEEAAEFLYKAGESYFATNDYENALPCFNKLKADPKYPRAKYMFALSLCAMGNCDEGKREYKEFAKTYKETDSRTLEIIFASQFEKCVLSKKSNLKAPNVVKAAENQSNTETQVSKPPLAQEYRIQFIAMKKPDASFPGVAKVGTIETEFFPNKSVYRYTLSGYNDVSIAAKDLTKVRSMGFRDAFIAVYENGQRVNTIYHKRK